MTLALKLVLTPLLIAGASLAGRRWGGAVAGSLVSLPLTSGPVSAFLAAEHGPRFAAHAAVGSLSGVAAESAFCLAFAWTARRGWAAALAAGTLGFAAAGAAAQALPLSARADEVFALFAAATVSLGVAFALLPRPRAAAAVELPPPPRWDLPARAVVATALVVALTELAGVAGARLVGLVAVFPVYVSVLAVFAHRHEGREALLGLLRGVVLGLSSFVGFFLVLGVGLDRVDTVAAYACATVAALAVQVVSLAAARR
ncbi:MAG TPA: hypothetical protein VFJ91_12325 [Gaiellaceae bacterium]|nr:hypothetical protein [Gaiellaceae bacterium]